MFLPHVVATCPAGNATCTFQSESGAALFNFTIVSKEEIEWTVDIMWTLVCAMLVFFMQAGFSMLEVGSVRAKNVRSILVKNIGDTVIGAITFWCFGYGFAYGSGSSFIGTSGLFAIGGGTDAKELSLWFFQWSFAATSTTIVSGALAERTRLAAYFCVTILLIGFCYPVAVHWAWAEGGWLSPYPLPGDTPIAGLGFIDYAGSGVVHTVGGVYALVGAKFVKPRAGESSRPLLSARAATPESSSGWLAGESHTQL